MAKVPIGQQVSAVELELVNRLGHIENIKSLIKKKQRTEDDLKIAELPIEALKEAVKTLKWVKENAIKLRKLAQNSN